MRCGLFWICALMLTVGASGCHSQSARIPLAEYELAAPKLTQSLQGSQWLAGRTPADPPVRVAITSIRNLTTDVIPLSEEWGLMQQLAARASDLPLCRKTHVRFMIPADRGRFLRRYETQPLIESAAPVGSVPPPTHIMSAVFRSIRRVRRNSSGYEKQVRMLYVLDAEITNVRTRQIVWHGSLEFQVTASGLTID